MNVVPFADLQNRFGHGGIGIGRKPPRVDVDAMALHRLDLGVKRRNIFVAPVVRETPEPKVLQHRRPLLRSSLLRIEGHDAPRGQIRGGEQDRRVGGPSGW